MHVLCLGDRFITSSALGDAARRALGRDVHVTGLDTEWPDVAFGPVQGVREAAGNPATIARLAVDADVILTHLAPITASVFDAATRLRIVGSVRGGPVNIDLAAASAHHVPVAYLPGRNLGAVAEFTVGVMITLPRSIARASRALAGGVWDASYFRFERTGPELRACTIGIVGAGAVGRRVAELVSAFGAHVVVHDPYVTEPLPYETVPLEKLLATSDIVSVHTRLTDETRKQFDASAFAAMKEGAYFVNTARGELVDQAALLAALESGHLAGAALDVFDPEPPAANDPLIARPDVVATPHLAGASRQVAVDSAHRVAAAVAEYLSSGQLRHCANPDFATTTG